MADCIGEPEGVGAAPCGTETDFGWAAFDTAIGRCAIVWGPRGIVGSQLPEPDDDALRRRLDRRFPGAIESSPSAAMRSVIDRIVALLDGRGGDLADVPLDMAGVDAFDARVYAEALKIRPGETLTYGELARRIGAPGAARAVGQAMAQNRFAPIVPCHRVVAAGGRAGGFSANGGATTKLRMLAIEALAVDPQRRLF